MIAQLTNQANEEGTSAQTEEDAMFQVRGRNEWDSTEVALF
jgi:hypothetical protein